MNIYALKNVQDITHAIVKCNGIPTSYANARVELITYAETGYNIS